jgi:hypothetical protein
MSAAENCRVGTNFDALQYPIIEIEQLLFRNPQICEESSENLVYPIKVFLNSEITSITNRQNCIYDKTFKVIKHDFDEILFVVDFYNIYVLMLSSRQKAIFWI